MTSSEFLQQLAAGLQCLQDEERANAMAYYHEYFEEAGEENEAEAVERLGSPQSVAERIIKEVGAESANASSQTAAASAAAQKPAAPAYDYTASAAAPAAGKDSTGRTILAVVLILLTMPFWCAIPIVWFTIVLLLVVLPVSLGCAGIGAVVQSAFTFMFGNLMGGMWDMGGGLFLIGFVMLTWYPCFKLAKLMTVGFGKMCAGIFKFLSGKE